MFVTRGHKEASPNRFKDGHAALCPFYFLPVLDERPVQVRYRVGKGRAPRDHWCLGLAGEVSAWKEVLAHEYHRFEHPPSSAELYQLTTYGLFYSMPEPREVLLLHPIGPSDARSSATLLFAPPAAGDQVRIRLVGVPVDGILNGTVERWWPLDRVETLDEPVLAQSV